MTPPGRRQTVIVLIAAPLAVLALVIMFRSGTPTVPEIGAPTPIVASRQPAQRLSSTPAAIPAAPETPAPPSSAPSSPAPELPAPVVSQPDPAPAAPNPAATALAPAPVPAIVAPPPPVRSRDSNFSAAAPSLPTAGPPSAEPTGETWMRKVFGVFLNLVGPPESELSEPERDALFAEFLAWRRARSSADHGQP